jgi:hypothetical protein
MQDWGNDLQGSLQLYTFMNASKKRKADADSDAEDSDPVERNAKKLTGKRSKGAKPMTDAPSSSKPGHSSIEGSSSNSTLPQTKGKRKAVEIQAANPVTDTTPPVKPKRTIKKLVPPRPFPTVLTSVSATGPRSQHKEGKNFICITRKTPLSSYLRRCKDVILKDGYKTLHLSAMGAAIPHLTTLIVSLPGILPFAPDEVHIDILTSSVQVQDEVVPEDEDEDISYQTRGKSTLSVVMKIGDGEDETRSNVAKNARQTGSKAARRAEGNRKRGKEVERTQKPAQIVFQEPEQEEMDVS